MGRELTQVSKVHLNTSSSLSQNFMKRKTKQSLMRILKKKLDKKFSEYIRLRDNFTCVLCGNKERPQCGHVFSRSSHNTRWDEKNSFCQCSGCNMRHEFDPYPYNNWFIEKFGKDAWDQMHQKWNTVRQWSMQELEDEIARLDIKIKELTATRSSDGRASVL